MVEIDETAKHRRKVVGGEGEGADNGRRSEAKSVVDVIQLQKKKEKTRPPPIRVLLSADLTHDMTSETRERERKEIKEKKLPDTNLS